MQAFHLIVAFIQPFQLEAVVDALRALPDFPGMSVSEVRGFGRHGAHPPRQGERTELDPFETKVRIEIFCSASQATVISHALRDAAHTGHPGDGKLFVLDAAWAMAIRTGQIGDVGLVGGQE